MKLAVLGTLLLSISFGDISLQPGDWNLSGTLAPAHPTALGGGGWFFDFPVVSSRKAEHCASGNRCASITYATVVHTDPLTEGAQLNLAFQITTAGAVTFNYKLESSNTCQAPAAFRPILIKSDTGGGEFDRWWSNPISGELVDSGGPAALSVALTPDQWSSIMGKRGDESPDATAGFRAVLASPSFVGLTFGGGCFFGHGVNVSGGTAQFQLRGYAVAEP